MWAIKNASLSPAELSLLVAIVDEGPIRATDLAGALGFDKSTISPQARRLERLGLVSRTAAEDDRRAALLTSTRAGRATAQRLERSASRLLGARLAHWTPRDREALTTLLERLLTDLNRDRVVS